MKRKQSQSNIFNLQEVSKVWGLVRAIKHPLRLKILDLLEEQARNVTDIYVQLRVEQSVASQHLAELRAYEIVVATRNGKAQIYSLNLEKIELIKDYLKSLSAVIK